METFKEKSSILRKVCISMLCVAICSFSNSGNRLRAENAVPSALAASSQQSFPKGKITVQGTGISAEFETGENEPVNQPGLRIYVDGKMEKEVVLTERYEKISLASFDEGVHIAA